MVVKVVITLSACAELSVVLCAVGEKSCRAPQSTYPSACDDQSDVGDHISDLKAIQFGITELDSLSYPQSYPALPHALTEHRR